MLDEVRVKSFLAWGRLLVGRPLLFWGLARRQPGEPALPAREPITLGGNHGRTMLGDDVRDLPRRGAGGPQEF